MRLAALQVILSAMAALTMTSAKVIPNRQGPSVNPGTPKYFHEPGDGEIYGHYDLRYYGGEPVSDAERRNSQHNMVRAYLSTMEALGYETWLAHGTLLGWWWNGKMLPWDGDLDVQLWGSSLPYLAASYNMTTHEFTHRETDEAGTVTEKTTEYLLDVNPNIDVRTRGNWMNVIDARWIDTSNGLFIDVTGVSENDQGLYSCKNYHAYKLEQLYPLHETTFEGIKAMVPNSYEEILRAEYKQKALVTTHYEGHYWDDDTQLWLKEQEQEQ